MYMTSCIVGYISSFLRWYICRLIAWERQHCNGNELVYLRKLPQVLKFSRYCFHRSLISLQFSLVIRVRFGRQWLKAPLAALANWWIGRYPRTLTTLANWWNVRYAWDRSRNRNACLVSTRSVERVWRVAAGHWSPEQRRWTVQYAERRSEFHWKDSANCRTISI